MKGNIKKLTVLVIIVAIAMFFVWAMASADDHKGKKSIRGQYAGTGAGTCIIAPGGFNEGGPVLPPNFSIDLTPKCGAAGTTCAIIQSFSREIVFTFEDDGAGSASGFGRVVQQNFLSSGPTTPPTPPVGSGLPSAGSAKVEFDFTYTVDDSGKVDIWQNGPYETEWTSGPNIGRTYQSKVWEFTGSVTPDGKVMNLTSRTVLPAIPTSTEMRWGLLWLVDPPGYESSIARMICNFDTVLIWQHD